MASTNRGRRMRVITEKIQNMFQQKVNNQYHRTLTDQKDIPAGTHPLDYYSQQQNSWGKSKKSIKGP
jgi:hypothetical protein